LGADVGFSRKRRKYWPFHCQPLPECCSLGTRGSSRHFSRGSQRSRCVEMPDEQMICMRSPFVRSCPEQGIRPFPGCGFKCCRRVWNDSGCVMVMLCPNESQCTNTWLCRRKGAPSTVVTYYAQTHACKKPVFLLTGSRCRSRYIRINTCPHCHSQVPSFVGPCARQPRLRLVRHAGDDEVHRQPLPGHCVQCCFKGSVTRRLPSNYFQGCSFSCTSCGCEAKVAALLAQAKAIVGLSTSPSFGNDFSLGLT